MMRTLSSNKVIEFFLNKRNYYRIATFILLFWQYFTNLCVLICRVTERCYEKEKNNNIGFSVSDGCLWL